MLDLKSKIIAVNKANKEAAVLHQNLIDVLTQFVGKKIVKTDGVLLTKIKELIKPFIQNSASVAIWQKPSLDELLFCVHVCVKPASGSLTYAEIVVAIGKIENAKLQSLHSIESIKYRDYTLQEIEEAIKRIQILKSELQTIKSNYRNFDSFLRY